MLSKEPVWVQSIIEKKSHVILHETSFENAVSILTSRQIFGSGGFTPLSTEAFPHFLYQGWLRGQNWLPAEAEVSLVFQTDLPARWRGEGTSPPEPGWLELYSIQGAPWQCSLHPDSSPLTFIGTQNCTLRQKWHDFIPVGRSLEGRLRRAADCALRENLEVSASWRA